MKEVFQITYRVTSTPAEVEARADGLLLEQTVEVPRAAIHSDWVRENIVGEVVSIAPAGEGQFLITVAQPWLTTGHDIAQFLNVLFGNSSIQPDVVLEDVSVPLGDEKATAFLPGPQFGIEGIRTLASAHARPLTSSALKPMGLPVEKLAELCGQFARAGIDLIKDDHGLANHPFSPFEERVRACLQAVQTAAYDTAREVIYVPNIIGSPETMKRQLAFAEQEGVKTVMVEPMIMGLPAFAEFAASAGLPILAHPAFGGVLRIAPPALLGKLFRLCGADAVIYPNYGGRFAYTKAECAALAHHLLAPWDRWRPSLPTPAGGIKLERVEELVSFYGNDVMLLLGASLLEKPGEVESRSRTFVEHVKAVAKEGGTAHQPIAG